MKKEDWLRICRLNMEWYFVQAVFDCKPLSNEDKKWMDKHMPSDDIFGDGRIEYFQENFKPSIDEKKLDELAIKEIGQSFSWPDRDENGNDKFKLREVFKAGYRKAKEE